MTTVTPDLDRLAIDTIRTLSIDGVQTGQLGPPRRPDGRGADGLHDLDAVPAPRPDTTRTGRIATGSSCRPGHASMLLYSLLHLTGYAVSMDDLKSFRQWGSITPGHPEYGLTPGVEATTGPLGQGLTNAVGMAIAERRLAAEFNARRADGAIVDHRTYVIASDGDLQEGVASEAASLAGHLRLGKLIVLYDDNLIQLDGPTKMAWSEDVPARFEAYGWHTQRVADGNDVDAIDGRDRGRPSRRPAEPHRRPDPHRLRQPEQAGLAEGARRAARPRRGPPDQGGLRLGPGPHVLRPGRRRCPLPRGDPRRRGARRGLGGAVRGVCGGRPGTRPPSSVGGCPAISPTAGTPTSRRTRPAPRSRRATRSQDAIQALGARVPELFGGAADLSESNLTDVKGEADFSADDGRPQPPLRCPRARDGRHRQRDRLSRRLPSRTCATFLTFSDYMRGSVRLASLAGLPRDLCLDPRLRRPRRGRPDPSAGRALRRPPGDPEPVVRPAWRCQRDGRGLGPRDGATRRPRGSGADPAEAADPARDVDGGTGRGRPGRLHPARGRRAGSHS